VTWKLYDKKWYKHVGRKCDRNSWYALEECSEKLTKVLLFNLAASKIDDQKIIWKVTARIYLKNNSQKLFEK
jgi:hypothetical protein